MSQLTLARRYVMTTVRAYLALVVVLIRESTGQHRWHPRLVVVTD